MAGTEPSSTPLPADAQTDFTGLLFSQIGYDARWPKHAVVRGGPQTLGPGAFFEASCAGRIVATGLLRPWGELWGSHWWIADFSSCDQAGLYRLAVCDGHGRTPFAAEEIEIGPDLLWRRTWESVALEQSEHRQRRAIRHDGRLLGWFDAGAQWQEANSHAALLFGLCDVLERRPERLTDDRRARLIDQLLNGSDYLGLLQDMARAQGHGAGPLVHQSFDRPHGLPPHGLHRIVLPGDAAKAAAAWARVAHLLPRGHEAKRAEYRVRSRDAMDWLLAAPRFAALPFLAFPHATADEFRLPDAIPTPELAMLVWAALETDDGRAFDLARQWVARQIPREEAADGLFGHFRLFDAGEPSERAWTHGIGREGIGFNNGSTFGHNLLPLLRLLDRYPAHPDAALWARTVEDYAYGYFLPACQANPFGLIPNGHYPGEGLVWFAGLWHGANAIYGNAAALAAEFAGRFNDAAFREAAAGNAQWIAGLNAGLTSPSLRSAHVFSAEVPAGEAVPVSLIHGIGRRTAGSWTNWRGSICNGFATGRQFAWDVPPTRANDGPHTFTDEDWITHAGGWLSAVARF